MPAADLARRDTADSVVRVVLSFEGDRFRLSSRDHMLSELVQLMTGGPLPYATLMYVWCTTRETGSVITNPRTERIRKPVPGTARWNWMVPCWHAILRASMRGLRLRRSACCADCFSFP